LVDKKPVLSKKTPFYYFSLNMPKPFVVAVLLTAGLVGCSNNDKNAEKSGEKQSKVVNVYTARHYEADTELFNKFTEETGIKVNVVKGEAEELIERLKREGESTEADLFITVDGGVLANAKKNDILQPASTKKINENVPEKFRDKDIQTTLRNHFHYQIDPELLSISSLRGAIFIFTLFLFPYVYMITKSFLENQSTAYFENARLLGRRPFSIFVKVILPLSRPAIVGGVVLVIYEVLGDYGVTSYFGIHTITTAIFQTWFGMYDVNSAMRLASWLMMMVVGLFFLERLLRKRKRYDAHVKSRKFQPVKLKGFSAIFAFLYNAIIFSFGFLIPFIQLIAWAKLTFHKVFNETFFTLLYQTLYVTIISSTLILVVAVIVANVNRTQSTTSFLLSKLITSGYSIPGAIIAIGVLAVFIKLDELLAPIYSLLGLGNAPLVLSLSIVMLIIGYFIRFMAIGYHAVEVGFEKIGNKYLEASRTLGHGMTKSFFKVELPLIKGAILSGFILTFVEICKELPLTLLLRPFNFETLATKTFQYAKDEMIHEAAIPSLIIILISTLSIIVLQVADKKVKQ
jgi:iron(III) transport system permease protein